MNPTAYPLHWPTGWKRTPLSDRTSGRFHAQRKVLTISAAATRLSDELERMAIPRDDIILSTNVALRLDGRPSSNDRLAKDDPGAAAYWRDGGVTRCMAVDRYNDVAQNIAALAATIEAMRAIERHGGAVVLERAFMGFAALPSAASWRGVLGIESDKPTRAEIDEAYKRRRSEAHPDKGGSEESFHGVQRAYEEALREVRR